MRRLLSTIAVAAAVIAAPAAQANPANTLQPSNVYFGRVVAGQHPERVVTLRNPNAHTMVLRRFLIAGAGGQKFTLVGRKGSIGATCRIGLHLTAHTSCTLIYRVKTTKPEYWQAVVSVYYTWLGHSTLRQANGAVYAHVVAS